MTSVVTFSSTNLDQHLSPTYSGLILGSFNCGKSSIIQTLVKAFKPGASFINVSSNELNIGLKLEDFLNTSNGRQHVLHADFIVYVMDVSNTDALASSIRALTRLLSWIARHAPTLPVERVSEVFVFLHKCDLLDVNGPSDSTESVVEEIRSRCNDSVGEIAASLNVRFCPTSIYDDSIHIAIGNILRNNLLLQRNHVKNLLQLFRKKLQYRALVLVDIEHRMVISSDGTEGSKNEFSVDLDTCKSNNCIVKDPMEHATDYNVIVAREGSHQIADEQLLAVVDLCHDLRQLAQTAASDDTKSMVQIEFEEENARFWCSCHSLVRSLCLVSVTEGQEMSITEANLVSFRKYLSQMLTSIQIDFTIRAVH